MKLINVTYLRHVSTLKIVSTFFDLLALLCELTFWTFIFKGNIILRILCDLFSCLFSTKYTGHSSHRVTNPCWRETVLRAMGSSRGNGRSIGSDPGLSSSAWPYLLHAAWCHKFGLGLSCPVLHRTIRWTNHHPYTRPAGAAVNLDLSRRRVRNNSYSEMILKGCVITWVGVV